MRQFLILLVIPVISGCALLTPGLSVETARERLVVAEYSYQAALKTVDRLIDTGLIKGESAVRTAELIHASKAGLLAARASVANNDEGAAEIINIANSFISQLITYLATKEDQTSWAPESFSLSKLYQPFLPHLRWLPAPLLASVPQ